MPEIAVSHDTSPRVSVYPFATVTGFGTKYTNPATVPTGTGNGVKFCGTSDIAVAHDTTPFVSAYPWTVGGGFGTKYANPATLPTGNGQGLAFCGNTDIVVASGITPYAGGWPWNPGVGFGTKYSNPTALAGTGTGVSFLSTVDVAFSHGTSPYISVLKWTPGAGFGGKYSNPGTLPTGTGNGIASCGTTDVAVAHTISPQITAYPWNLGVGFGTKYSNPGTLPSGTAYGTAFCGSTDITVGCDSSPRIVTYPFTPGVGFGTNYSAPGILPPTNGRRPAFNSSTDVAIATGSSQYITAYPFTTGVGYGTKYANPGTLPTGAGTNTAFLSLVFPQVTTQAVTDIVGGTTATGNGNITSTGGENCDKRGFVYGVSSFGNPGNVAPGSSGYDTYVEDAGSYGTGAFTKTLTGLTPGVIYYVRAYTHNSAGYAYGDEVNFDNMAPPILTTEPPSVGWETGTGHGTIVDLCGSTVTTRGVCWNETGTPTVADPRVEENGSFGVGAFSLPMTGLTPETHYYIRAYGYNEAGLAYGDEEEFDTTEELIVESHFPLDVAALQVTGFGTIVQGAAGVDERGFEWGLEPGVYLEEVTETDPFVDGDFTLAITGLDFLTLYYYRAKAHHAGLDIWVYGDEIFFYTLAPTPVVDTEPPVDAQIDHIDAAGNITSTGGDVSCDKRGFVYGLTRVEEDPGNVAPAASGYDDYEEESDAFGTGQYEVCLPNYQDSGMTLAGGIDDTQDTFQVTGVEYASVGLDIKIDDEKMTILAIDASTLTVTRGDNGSTPASHLADAVIYYREDLEPSRIYYIRAYAHNSYGYAYGDEIKAISSYTVNLLYPSGDYLTNIRFKTSYKPQYFCVRHEDAVPFVGGYWNWFTGKFLYEYNYYNDDFYTSLFHLTNPIRRTEEILKVKWKATVMSSDYPFGKYKREIRTEGVTYTGAESSALSWPTLKHVCEIFNNNLNTGVPWTLQEADDLIAGITLGQGGSYGRPSCDLIEARVLWANASVVTDGMSNYGGSSARLNGHVTEDEGEECTVYFEYGISTSYGSTTTPETKRIFESFYADIAGLDPTESYHYRAVIVTACGETFYGTDITFPGPSYPGIWLGTEDDPFQMEITATVLGARVERGRDEELGHAAAGIAELTCDNEGGDYSPERTDGLYYTYLYLGAYLTIVDTHNDILYPMFSGKIETIEPHPEPDNRTAYILAVDGSDDLEGSEIETPLRVDTDEAVLVDDILDAAGWHVAKREIGAGVDTLQLGWFHEVYALPSLQDLEDSTRGFFFVKPDGANAGVAVWQNRHYRVTGARLISQYTFNESAVEVSYKWSKRDVRNWIKVTGYQYQEWDDDSFIWYAPCNFSGAPVVPAGATIHVWASLAGPRSSSDALVKGTHWNANTAYDKTGDDVSDDITVTPTYYGQAIDFAIANAGDLDAYLVVPNSPPAGAPGDGTLLVHGKLYEEATFSVIEEDGPSQTKYGKRTLSIDAKFKSNYNDILSYAQYLLERGREAFPVPIAIVFNAWTDYPDDTLKIQALSRAISDRVTFVSSHLGVNKDYYIDKIIQEYVAQEGSWVHMCTFVLSRAEGQAEGQYWILGVVGFSELGETTRLGF